MHTQMTVKLLLVWGLNLVSYLIIADIILSYVIQFRKISPHHPVVKFVQRLVNPILNPLRRILPPPWKTGGLDLSPTLAVFILWLVSSLIAGS